MLVATGAVRWYRLAKLSGSGPSMLALIVFSRLLEIEMLLLLGTVFWLADPHAPARFAGATLFAGGFLLAFLARFVAFHPAVARRVSASLQRVWPADRALRLRRHTLDLLEVTGRYGVISARPRAVLALTVFASHMLNLLALALLARGVGMDVSWLTLGWARSILGLALLLPITWAGIGLREATLTGALVAAGQPAAAVALGLLVTLRALLEAAAGGLVEWRDWLSRDRQDGGGSG